MAEPTAGGVPLWPVTTAMGDTVYVRSDKIDNEPVLAAFSEDGARRPRDVSRAEISGAPDGSGFWNTGFGGYLKNSYDALQRGVKSIPATVEHYAQEYGKPAAEVAANLLPGAGLVEGQQDFGRMGQALKEGRYKDAAIDAGYGLVNAGTEFIPAMSAMPPIKRPRGSFEMDYFGQPVRILQNPSAQDLQGFLSRTKYKAARRITDPKTGEVYVWDAGDPALHKLVAERLGIEYDDAMGDVIGLD